MIWIQQLKTPAIVMVSLLFVAGVSFSGCTQNSEAGDTPTAKQTEHQQKTQLYTCSMHPDVIQDEPGDCPICGMTLVPLKANDSTSAQNEVHDDAQHISKTETQSTSNAGNGAQLYTCGMHPNVIQDEPGDCPICGMKLVPLKKGTAQSGGKTMSDPPKDGKGKVLYWRAPMDPSYISNKPGKSPMGMDLVPVYEGQENFGSTIKIDPTVEQNMGVRTAPVLQRHLSREIRALGHVTYDQSKLAHVHTKVDGYIEKSYINAVGDQVKKGDPLVEIYSPKLVSTQEEYLQAYRSLQRLAARSATGQELSQSKELLESARRRLEYWDISDRQINTLEQTGTVTKTMQLNSPFDGIVVDLKAIEGMRVQPGMRLYNIANLNTVWVESDIYEYELPWLKEGQHVAMNLSYVPGQQFNGYVDYIYPFLESKTRTVKVRSVFDNASGELKPGMYANVRIQSSIGDSVTAIPEESVIYSGERTLVFISLGKGRFVPRDVKLGAISGDGYYQVLSGIEPGEIVVTSGQFLLDSESKLKEALQKMIAKRQNQSKTATSSAANQDSAAMESNSEMNMQMDHDQ